LNTPIKKKKKKHNRPTLDDVAATLNKTEPRRSQRLAEKNGKR